MESRIERATTSEKILILLALIFSASGFVWLALMPEKPSTSHMLSRIGFIAAIFALPLASDDLLDFVLCVYGPEARVVAQSGRGSVCLGWRGLGFLFSGYKRCTRRGFNGGPSRIDSDARPKTGQPLNSTALPQPNGTLPAPRIESPQKCQRP
jgi:hypothetical protein